MTNGWIKLHRKMIDWEWYQDTNIKCLFLHLILIANHDPKKWRGIDINRGQIVTGRTSLSEETGLSEQTIRTCLDKLKSTNEITIQSTNRFSIISINKYDTYQITERDINQQTNQQTNQQLTSSQPAENQQITTNKKRTCLDKLKSTNEITSQSTNRFGIISINKYDTYQITERDINQQTNQQTNQQLTSSQPAVNQQVTTNKNNKNNKNEKNNKNRKEKNFKKESFETPEGKAEILKRLGKTPEEICQILSLPNQPM